MRTWILRRFICRCHVVFLWCCVCFVLFHFVFMLSLKPRPFVQSVFVVRNACAPTATRSYLTTVCCVLFVYVPFFSYFFLLFRFFGDVAFSGYFCTTIVLSCTEYVVRFPLPDGVFLPCDHGLDFLHHRSILLLCGNSINQSNTSNNMSFLIIQT